MIPQLDSAPAERTDSLALWAAALNMIALAAVTFAFSWATYMLDEVKLTVFLIAGPLLMLAGLAALWRGQSPAPPRLVALGLAAYGAVLILSTLMSRFAWAGELQLLFFWSAAGFFLTGFCAGASPRPSLLYSRFLALLLLGVCVIGFLMFDPTGRHHSALSWLHHRLYGGQKMPGRPFSYFLDLLSNADDQLQSTVFSSSFFCGICLMLAPFAAQLAVASGPGRWRWRAAGYASLFTATAAVLLSKPSGPALVVAAFAVALFLALFVRSGSDSASRRSALLLFITLALWTLLVVGLQRWGFHSSLIFHNDKFWSMRGIIWSAALSLFKAHPVLGGGPGTFMIHFNASRSPDYYLYDINNVTTASHNIFLDVLSETGALGLVAFLLLLVALLAPALRQLLRRPAPPLRAPLAAAATSLIVFLLYNGFDPVGRWVIGMAPLWSVMGFLGGLSVQSHRIATDASLLGEPALLPAAPAPATRLLALACLLPALVILPFSAVYGLRHFRGEMAYTRGYSDLEAATSAMTHGENNPEKLAAPLQRAAEFFRASMTTNNISVSANYKLGSACCTLSQVEEQRMRDAKKKGDQAEAARLDIQSARHLAEAVQAYEDLARLSPDYAEIHYNFGVVYHLAAELLRREPRFALGFDKTADEYDQLALAHLLRMARQSSKPEVACMAGNQLTALGRHDEALKILRQGSDRHPDDSWLAQLYFSAAQKAGAKDDEARARARVEAIEKKKK